MLRPGVAGVCSISLGALHGGPACYMGYIQKHVPPRFARRLLNDSGTNGDSPGNHCGFLSFEKKDEYGYGIV